LLEEYEALWAFLRGSGIQPTSNTPGRLRHAVIMRKIQLGTHSDQGSRWIERPARSARPTASKTAFRSNTSSTWPSPPTTDVRIGDEEEISPSRTALRSDVPLWCNLPKLPATPAQFRASSS
jgi:hypothetical protein